MNIDKYYICHYSKLSERKQYIESHIKKFNIELEWILSYDKEDIDWENLDKTYPKIYDIMSEFMRKLSKPEISLLLKHLEIFREVIKNNYQNVVVFEYDIILDNDFNNKLDNYILQLPTDYDIFWIGSCCNLHAQLIANKNVYDATSSRCTHTYMISKKGCEKMLECLNELNHPIDWYFNYVIKQKKLKNYWAEPDLAKQDLSFESYINSGLVN